MKALTIRQPWATLIACGAKTIETRGWSTRYRGPLLIHAGKAPPHAGRIESSDWWVSRAAWCEHGWRMTASPSHEDPPIDLPLGAVVAVAELVDVLPIVDDSDPTPAGEHIGAWSDPSGAPVLWHAGPSQYVDVDGCGHYEDQREAHPIDDQLPFGDFTPGRFGWLLDNVRPLTQPIPAKGRQGLWTPGPTMQAVAEHRAPVPSVLTPKETP